MDVLRVSLVQYEVRWEDPVSNRHFLQQLLDPLKGTTDLIILPEMFTTGFTMQAARLAEQMDGETVAWMKAMAMHTNAAIAGSLIVAEHGNHYNRLVFVTPSGNLSHYDKRHLFSIGQENRHFQPGNSRVVVQYAGWRIALYICYDLRFPVWCRSMLDADLMIFSANWPESRGVVWKTLLQARALENQLYVAGVNRVGRDGFGISHAGESMLIDARGATRINMEEKPASVETCPISLPELNKFREKFPVFRDEDQFNLLV